MRLVFAVLLLIFCASISWPACSDDGGVRSNDGVVRPAFGPSLSLEQASGRIIDRVTISGLEKTKDFVIWREITLKVEEKLNPADLNLSVRRLKNLLIFREVQTQLIPVGADRVRVDFLLAEKWTLIPIILFQATEGTQVYQLGVYDPNVLGHYFEVGTRYENRDGRGSVLFWYRRPRLFGKRLRLGLTAGSVVRIRNIYDNASQSLVGTFTQDRLRFNLFADGEVNDWLRLGGGIDFQFDQIGNQGLSDAQVSLNAGSRFDPTAKSKARVLQLYAKLWELDQDDFLEEGKQVILRVDRSEPALGSDELFHRVTLDAERFFRLWGYSNLGFRGLAGWTDTSQIQQLSYLGGLDTVRGYPDSRFQAKSYALLNTELRVPSLRTTHLVLQHAFFSDTLLLPGSGLYPSFGTGIRVLPPALYSVALRLDYAVYLRPQAGQGISFGVLQFF